jgi:hypothetical protein
LWWSWCCRRRGRRQGPGGRGQRSWPAGRNGYRALHCFLSQSIACFLLVELLPSPQIDTWAGYFYGRRPGGGPEAR